MKSSINLLKREKKSEGGGYRSYAQLGTVILFVFYILAFLGVFGFYFFTARQEKKVSASLELQEREIKRLTKVESLQLGLKNRITALKEILGKEDKAVGIADCLSRIGRLLGDRVVINSFEVSNFGDSVSLRIAVSDTQELISLFDRLSETGKKEGGFDNFALDTLSKAKSGYQLSIVLSNSI
jgi:hypothetical protein